MKSDMKVRLTNPAGDRSTEGTIQVSEWNAAERTRKTLMVTGGLIAASIFSIFIPLLHFVLVPGFLLLALVAFYLVGQQAGQILGGEGKCPECGAPLKIAASTLKFPQTDLCTSCHRNVRIERLPATS